MRRAASSPRWAWVVLTLLCVGAVVAAVLVVGPESAPAAKSRTVTAERGVVQSTVSGSGTIQARQTDVNFASAGRLTDVKVKAGQHVVEGQELATTDPRSAELTLEQAEAQLRSAQAGLSSAEAQQVSSSQSANSSASKGATGPSSQNQNQKQNQSSGGTPAASKQASIDQAQAQVDSAEAAVENAQQGVSDTTLTSPVSGTVASVNAGVGDYVSGGGSSNASQ